MNIDKKGLIADEHHDFVQSKACVAKNNKSSNQFLEPGYLGWFLLSRFLKAFDWQA